MSTETAAPPVTTRAPVAETRRGKFRYGWIVLAVATMVVLLAAGTRAAPGALLLGIQADTGWSVAQVSLAGAAGLLLLGLGGPVSGLLIDRFGIRRLAVGALLLTAVGMGSSAFSRELWQLVVRQVRSEQSEVRVPYRCDSAHARRWFEMAIAPVADGGHGEFGGYSQGPAGGRGRPAGRRARRAAR